MKLPRCEECLFPPHRGNVNNRLRPEKVLSSCFRTGVRFPSAPPCKNAIPNGMAFLHGCAEGREKPSGSTDWISRRVNAAILRFAQNQKENPVGTEAAKPPEYSPRLHPATERLPSQGPIPPIRGKCPEGTKRVGMLSAKLTRGCCKFAIKPKPQIQFAVWKGRNEHRGKEAPRIAEARSVVVISDAPPAAPSFPSCRKRRGEKRGAWTRFGASCL